VQVPLAGHVVAQLLPEHAVEHGDDEHALAQPPDGHAHWAQVCCMRVPPSSGSGIGGPPFGVPEGPEHARRTTTAGAM
jgi:hypothetical protein